MPVDSDIGTTFTVGELIESLKQFDKDLPVITEGCDCFGRVARVVREGESILGYLHQEVTGGYVLIARYANE